MPTLGNSVEYVDYPGEGEPFEYVYYEYYYDYEYEDEPVTIQVFFVVKSAFYSIDNSFLH